MATQSPTEAPPAEPGKTGFTFPSAFTVLFIVLVAVWGLSFIVPAGSYDYVDCGDGAKPIPKSYHEVETDTTFTGKLYDLMLAPVNGLYGIQAPQEPVASGPAVATAEQVEAACGGDAADAVILGGNNPIGPYESGDLIGAVQVFFFVLAIGGFITITINTGSLDAGIARLVHRFRTRATTLIIILMAVFALGGTSYGMAEETLGFYALIVPIMVALGYDRMVGAAVIMLGAGVGTLASTVNPFATGAGSDAAGIAFGDGLLWRFVIFLILVPITMVYVLRYAARVRKDPATSLVPPPAGDEEPAARSDESSAEPPAMDSSQRLVMWVFILTFVLMIFSVIPFGDIFADSDFAATITLGWYFPELTALFLTMTVVIGMVGRMGESGTVDSMVAGMGDFMGAAFIIALARGVTVIMNNASITDTVLNSLEGVVSAVPAAAFGVVMFVVNIPIAFLVPSTSGHASLAMPIMAPLGDFADVSRAMVVTAYQSASGWMNLFTPTSAVVMGGLTLAKVGYDKYLRFVAPLLAILFVVICLLMGVGTLMPETISGSIS